jgi:hypothetical protein
MIPTSLFSKYQKMEVVPIPTLFEPDLLLAVNQKKCPFCLCKLYEMRNKPFWYCKSKKHKSRFIISKDKMR